MEQKNTYNNIKYILTNNARIEMKFYTQWQRQQKVLKSYSHLGGDFIYRKSIETKKSTKKNATLKA